MESKKKEKRGCFGDYFVGGPIYNGLKLGSK